ncbi:MAG: phage holin family protein [Actinobacteria bacterium]|jgi:putative membrane protein|nr:phage holin family protein [Actinomycetota bacterium]
MKSLLIRWVALGGAIWAAAYFVPGIEVKNGDFVTYAGIALIFGLVNATIGTLTKILTFPITILSLGLSMLVINGAMLVITDSASDALSIASIWDAILGALLISIASAVINKIISAFVKK